MPGDILDAIRDGNPFLENRVNGPAPAAHDAETIHAAAFAKLTDLAGRCLTTSTGLGAMLWSGAGLGKSHLLSRLGRWSGDGDRARFVYAHNLQARPEAMPRALLRRVVSTLTLGRRSGFFGTPLFHLARAGANEAAGDVSRYGWQELRRLHAAWLDRLGGSGGDRQIHEVLFAFLKSAYNHAQKRETGDVADLAVRWLSGDALDPEQAKQLGLPGPGKAGDAVCLEDAEQAKQALVAIGRLCGSEKRPLVVAVDQVDNLDAEQIAALSRFAEALLDSVPNLLLVTAGVMATLREWKASNLIQESAWDRLGQFEIRLNPLTAAQAGTLVSKRVDSVFAGREPPPEVSRLRRLDALFPLSRGWLASALADAGDHRPRDVVRAAAEEWSRQQEALRRLGDAEWLAAWGKDSPNGAKPPVPPAVADPAHRAGMIDQAVEAEMRRRIEAWRGEPGSMPADEDRYLASLTAVLRMCADPAVPFGLAEVEAVPRGKGKSPAYHLRLRMSGGTGEETRGIVVVATTSATSAAAVLRRLTEDLPPPNRVLVLTDARMPMPRGPKGNEYHQRLALRGPDRFRHLQATFDEVLRLHALADVADRAASGDVEIVVGAKSEALTPADVAESHRRAGRLAKSDIVRAVLGK